MYDQTGSLEDSDDLAREQFDSLYKYYRGLYRKVSFFAQHLVSVDNSLPGRRHTLQLSLAAALSMPGDAARLHYLHSPLCYHVSVIVQQQFINPGRPFCHCLKLLVNT